LQSERRGNAKNTLIWEISELKREAARNNTPSTFAKAVKAQRAAAQKEKELAALMQDKAKTWEDKAAWGLSTAQVRRTSCMLCQQLVSCASEVPLNVGAAQVILLFSAVLLFWNKPVAQLPPGLAWPMSSFLAAPSKSWATYGLIAAGPWVGLCMRASNGIARVIFPARAPGSSSASKLGRSSTKQD
jgi:hypothetical protein